MDPTDEQWTVIGSKLPPRKLKRPDRPGRPPKEPRAVWNGILWVLRTGAQWNEMPSKYPPYQTCHRWFQRWSENVTFRTVLRALAMDLKERGGFDLKEGFVDASFSGAKKGGPASGKRSAGSGPRSWQLQTALVAISIASASPHEVKLIEEALDQSLIDELSDRLIGDKAYDSDRLDERLWHERGVKLIAPHRRGRRIVTQDGRELRRYRRRWQVLRLFAWFHSLAASSFATSAKAINFLGFLHIACSLILLRQF